MINIEKNNRLIVKIIDRLDTSNSQEADEIVIEALKNLDSDIVIDVSELVYISSAGLQVILRCAKGAKSASKEIFLSGAKDSVLEIFKISGFLTFIKEI